MSERITRFNVGNRFLLCVAILLTAMVVGCGGNRLDNVSPAPFQQPAAGQLSLPAPVGLAERVGSALTSSRLGSDYDAVLLPPQKVNPAGEKGLYEPTWLNATDSGFDDLAYALYTFELPDYEQGRYLNSTWSIPPASGSYWVALGNMVTDSWKWFNATPGEQLIVPEMENYINASDVLLAVVVVADSGQFMLDQVWFEGEVPSIVQVTPIQGDPGNPVTFNAEVNGEPGFSYAWDFGGATIPSQSTDESPSVVFGTVGKYDARLTVTNGLGVDTFDFSLHVGVPIIVDISPTWGISGQDYLFGATVFSTQPVSYAWNFGGGGIPDNSDLSAPVVTLGASGEYSASLTVLNSYGADNLDFTLTVKEPPVAALEAVPTSGTAPFEVSLDASGSYDPDGSIVLFEWDWDNDGIFDDATGTNPLTTHVYSVMGEHQLQVRVTDEDGASDTAADTIWVVPGQVANLNATDGTGQDKVLITWNQTDGADGYKLQYKNNAGGSPATWTDLDSVNGGSTLRFYHTSAYPVGKECAYNTVYEYRAKATLGAGESVNWSATDTGFRFDNWTMFGHDTKHTRLSKHTGPSTNNLRWSFTAGDRVTSSPSICLDGTVYFGCLDSKLYAINSDGSLRWSFTTGGWVSSSPATGIDGIVYFGSWDNKLYAVNSDGTLSWSYTTDGIIPSSPAIGDDGTVYVGSRDNKLHAINPDGSEKWSFTTGGEVNCSPAINSDGTVYVGSWDNKLYAINPDGSEKWTFTSGGYIMSSPAISSDGTVFFGSGDNKLYAVNPDGSEKWAYTTGDEIGGSPALDIDGTVYFGSSDNKLYALNPVGSLKWTYTTGDMVRSSPAIGANGIVYVGSYDNKLYAINPDGSLLWSYSTGDKVYSSPAIGADGRVFVGSYDGKLYAFQDVQ